MTKPARHRAGFVIVLRPEAGLTDEQATRALRAILKDALRRHGMRCLSAEPTKEHGEGPPEMALPAILTPEGGK